MTRKGNGNNGEQEIIKLISCPNCGHKLMLLPTHTALTDVQCTKCMFRAQVKTLQHKPTDTVPGSGWDVVDKVLKAGFLPPPLLINFKWKEKGRARQAILFFPFVPKTHLKKYKLSATHPQAGYAMFNYTGLSTLPHFELFKK